MDIKEIVNLLYTAIDLAADGGPAAFSDEEYSEMHELLKKIKSGQFGWHPASELPPEEGEYIAIDNGMPDVFRVDYLEPFGWCVEVMGAHEVVNVKWWIAPPKKE